MGVIPTIERCQGCFPVHRAVLASTIPHVRHARLRTYHYIGLKCHAAAYVHLQLIVGLQVGWLLAGVYRHNAPFGPVVVSWEVQKLFVSKLVLLLRTTWQESYIPPIGQHLETPEFPPAWIHYETDPFRLKRSDLRRYCCAMSIPQIYNIEIGYPYHVKDETAALSTVVSTNSRSLRATAGRKMYPSRGP